jgi:hypothetical protein
MCFYKRLRNCKKNKSDKFIPILIINSLFNFIGIKKAGSADYLMSVKKSFGSCFFSDKMKVLLGSSRHFY